MIHYYTFIDVHGYSWMFVDFHGNLCAENSFHPMD